MQAKIALNNPLTSTTSSTSIVGYTSSIQDLQITLNNNYLSGVIAETSLVCTLDGITIQLEAGGIENLGYFPLGWS